jgi:diamine N-acetyltransferase
MINLKMKPTLVGEKAILRPFKSEDISDMEECLKDPEVIKLTGSDSSYDKESTIEWYNTRNIQEDRLDLAIEDKDGHFVIGEAVMNLYDAEKNSMNYRILIGPRGRDRGIGSEVTRLMINYVFENTDLKQISLSVYEFNPRAQRVYEKIGFVLESIDKADLEYEGVMIDSYNMVLTRERWSQRL